MSITGRIKPFCIIPVVTLILSITVITPAESAEIGLPGEFRGDVARASQTALYEPEQSIGNDFSAQTYPLNAGDIQIARALDYLRNVQQADGRIAAFSTSAWAMMAIAAAGEDPHTWAKGGVSIVDYLRNNANHLDPDKATDWERSVLAIVATGENPRYFGGIDYIDSLMGLYDGVQMGDDTLVNDDFWGILALASIGESPEAIQNMRDFIVVNQNADGGWGWGVGGNSDADNTSVALSALVAAGEPTGSQTVSNALDYLKSQQQGNGGFVSEGNINSAVNSWVINAINDIGQSPVADNWSQGGNNAVGFLLSLQDIDGAFKWSASQRSNPEWMTAYAIIALLGKSWPEDNTPPSLSNAGPFPGVSITSNSVSFSVSYSDTVSGIDNSTARIILDGNEVTAGAAITDSGLNYTAPAPALGSHSVRVIIRDRRGNEASQNWSFDIISGQVLDPPPLLSSNPSPLPGETIVESVVNEEGVFKEGITAVSADRKCILTIKEGTTGLTVDGDPLSTISIEEIEPSPPPPQTGIIGLVYELVPDKSTFNPPASLMLKYDPSEIPEGVNESNLVVANYDEESGRWEELPGIVNKEDSTITAPVSHFSAVSILAHVQPASFSLGGLSIVPAEAAVGERVDISVIVTNKGDLHGSYEVVLKIGSIPVETREVTLAAKKSESVTFSITRDTAGSYSVDIGGLSGAFIVKEITRDLVPLPTPIEPSEPPDAALVSEPAPVSESTPVPQPVTDWTANWPLIFIIIVALIAVGSIGVVAFYIFKGERSELEDGDET